jgi:hypothetical protein
MQFIGLAGVAKAGKDTFYQGLVRAYPQYKFARVSVGDIIRNDLNDFILKHTGISVWNASPQEKEQIRPLLAWYGDIKRKQTKGMYFLDQIFALVSSQHKDVDYAVLTDIRFKEFPFDEPDWIHNLNGKVIHIQRQLPDGTYAQPANDLERVNDPKVRDAADMTISWPTLLPTDDLIQSVAEIVKKLEPLSPKLTQTFRN